MSARRALLYVSLLATISVAWLVSPKRTESGPYFDCGRFQPLNQWMVVAINCDSPAFLRGARQPSLLLTEGYVRQSRPLMIAGAALVAPALRWLPLDPHYTAFVLFNFLLLGASVWLFDQVLTHQGVPGAIVVPLSVFLMANTLTKGFLWTPHQQLFAVFTPLFVIALSRVVVTRAASVIAWPLVGLLVGILLLAYGNLAIALPLVLFVWGVRTQRTPIHPGFRLGVSALIVAAFILPTLIWVWTVNVVAGSYYSHEITQYRQFVWITDAWDRGGLEFLETLARHTVRFARTFRSPQIWPFLISAMGLIAWRFRRERRKTRLDMSSLVGCAGSVQALASLTFVVSAAALWTLGTYQARLTITLVPIALVVIGLELATLAHDQPNLQLPLQRSLAALALLWVAWHVATHEPFPPGRVSDPPSQFRRDDVSPLIRPVSD